ncbi:MAG TPA: PA2779 family protein [Woeseiaceae bacterium]
MRVVSVSLICMGFAQVAPAGMIGTSQLLENEARAESLTRIEMLLARDDVGQQLMTLGVEPALVLERLNAMTTEELLALEHRFDEQVAGGDALAIIGTVFLVLLILELVGVTDIFKSI